MGIGGTAPGQETDSKGRIRNYSATYQLGAGSFSGGTFIPNKIFLRDKNKTDVDFRSHSEFDDAFDNPFKFLTEVATKKESNLSSIQTLNLFQKDPLLTLNKGGRVELTEEAYSQAGAEGFDANFINEGLREQYLAFYSEELAANVLGSIVDKEFVNTGLKINIQGAADRLSGQAREHGFITDVIMDSKDEFSFRDFGFKNPDFQSTDEINAYNEGLNPGVKFERSSVNIFSGAVREREFKTGSTLTKNILSGATTKIGSDRADDLLGINKDK